MADTGYLGDDYVHPGRREGVRVISISLSREGLAILREECPQGSKHQGAFFDRLLVEYRARKEERARLRAQLDAALTA
jgi:hypothetical protein